MPDKLTLVGDCATLSVIESVYPGPPALGQTASHHGAAVAILKGSSSEVGMVRMVQATPDQCVLEATIDGLTPGLDYKVKVHDYGDLSKGCDRYVCM